MALDVAAIAKKAMDGVAAKLNGVIHDVTLSHTDSSPLYDAATGAVVPGAPILSQGRAVDESGSSSVIIKNAFPHYVIVGGERVLFLEGLDRAPVPSDVITSPTLKEGKVMAVQNLLGAGQVYRVIVL